MGADAYRELEGALDELAAVGGETEVQSVLDEHNVKMSVSECRDYVSRMIVILDLSGCP